MNIVLEVIDKTGRKIRLTQRQWTHITTSHAEMANYLEEIKYALINPIKIIQHTVGNLRKYYTYQKNRKFPEKFLRVVVKYLNGEGFAITAQFVRYIR